MVELLGLVRIGNVLNHWKDGRFSYNLRGLQTDLDWQLESQLKLVGARMKPLVYFVTFVIVAVSATVSTTHYALLYFGVHLLGMLHGAGIPMLVFGMLPFPIPPDPPPYIAMACSAPLLILALRRLVILTRSGSFTPPEFRGFAYVVAWIGLGLTLAAAGVYLFFTHSVIITLHALSPASWAVMLAFFLAELTGPLKQRPVLKRFAVAMGVVALAAIFLPWDVYVGKLAYDRLCVSRAGEKVYATVHTPSYLLVGEARGSDGFGIYTAVNDVLDRRFSFVEVQRQPGNTAQINSLNGWFNFRVPDAKFFRITLGSAGAAACLPADRGPIRQAIAGRLKPGECLQFYPIEAPTSRYEIDVEHDAKPAWYTWRVFMQRVSVTDRQTGSLLGESTVYQRVGGRLSSNRELEDRECPKPRERRSLRELRKAVLL